MIPISEISSDVRALADFLMRSNTLVTYGAMQEAVKRDIRGRDRHVLIAALRECQRQGRLFGVVRGIGFRPLTAEEAINAGYGALPKIRRAANRAIQQITAVEDFETLRNETKIRHNALLSVMGMVSHACSEPGMRTIEDKVTKSAQTLSIGQTLDAFR